MQTEAAKGKEAAEIRELLNGWAQAVRDKNGEGITRHVSPDVMMFDLINPLQYFGSEALPKRAEQWLAGFSGAVGFEMKDLKITAGGEVAFCHSLNGVKGTRTDGTKIDMWWRSTLGLRKVRDTWKIVHEHSSVPFDMETGKASFDLKPGG